ncbi:hypothetical protein ACLB2K_012587 [Fragaria x ananassa]
MFVRFGNPDSHMITMTNSMVTTQDTGSAPPMEQIIQMFEELKGLIEATATQQSVTDLIELVKKDRVLWKADQDNPAILNEDFNEHVFAKKIELPSSQSTDKDFPFHKPTSREETTLSINDEEHEVEAGEIIDNNPISKFNGVSQKDELEGRTEQCHELPFS